VQQPYNTIALIVAAGSGQRVGGAIPKQYLDLGGIAILRRSVLAFLEHPKIDAVRVAYNPADDDLYQKAVAGLDILPPIAGGVTRQDSVRLGLESLLEFSPQKVLIHDAARPFVSDDIISQVLKHNAAIPAIAVEDTLKKTDGGKIVATVGRESLMRAQTPQGFLYRDILAAHKKVAGQSFTDDAAIYEHLGLEVAIVPGSQENFKITTEEDFIRAERMMTDNTNSTRGVELVETRTGTGFDVHKFCAAKSPNNKIIICGVEVPHDMSLEGHSDADVGIHSVVDAILGAIAQGDIGDHFPPSDPKWKGADSKMFLEHARDLVHKKNGKIVNVDVTIICEKPKLMAYKKVMAAKLAEILGIENSRVSVKATTTEGLGFTGRGEGIAAQAIASVTV
jgi:2-C-methyl-D-erythritol 4-phosphate cytidylyltransferase/2-C-methyl-D-erythritol 2,4-cyclodiphosphate synthase